MMDTSKAHSHDHGHDHGHDWAGNALLMVGLVYIAYGLAEMVAAWMIGSSAAMASADAGHNMTDGASYLAFYALGRILVRHSRARLLTDMLLGVAGCAAYLAGLVLPQLHDHGHEGPLTIRTATAMVVLGLVSFLMAKLLHGRSGCASAGLSAHLLGDMAGALGVIVAPGFLYIAPGNEWLLGVAVVFIMAVVAYRELRPAWRELWQRGGSPVAQERS